MQKTKPDVTTSPLQRAQQAVAHLFGISQPEAIQFTLNGSCALSQAILSFPWNPGDGIVISAIASRSVLRAVRKMARERGIQFYIVPYTDTIPFDPHTLEALLQNYPNIRIVVAPHASDVIGSLLPVENIGQLTRQHNKLFWLDITETMGRVPIDAQNLNINLLTGRGNQTLSIPQNTAVLYPGPEDILKQAHLTADTLNQVTQAISQSQQMGLSRIREHENAMTAELLDGLLAIPEVMVYGHAEIAQKIPVVSFNVLNQHPHIVTEQLPCLNHVSLEAGFHGSPMAHEAIGTIHRGGTLRVELNYRTSLDAIDALLSVLKHIIYSAPERKQRNKQADTPVN